MLKTIQAQENIASAKEKAKAVAIKLGEIKLLEVAKKVEQGVDETLSYMSFPKAHWLKTRSNNAIERLNREIRRRTRVVGAFHDGNSALMLFCVRLRYLEDKAWGNKLYMSIEHLYSPEGTLDEVLIN